MRQRQWRWVVAVLAGASIGAAAQAPSGDAQRGKAAYHKNMCDACHGSAGQGTRYGPKLAPPLPAEAFDHQVRHPRSAMPRFPSEYVSDSELADMEAWLASLPHDKPAKDIPLLKE